MAKRLCKCGCGQVITGHPNKKFFSTKHKDKHHNRINPRGFYAPIKRDSIESVGHKIDPIEDSMHPQDSYSLGQE